ncbi:hypothetical protein FPT84_23470 [Salmonella enterica]|uniref:Uncharacterized protein n=1 Tax=Salmonella enterica I TaxID=59201 RepID=A0A5U3G381_SALET|nr:hypothetical protein [Salmonella enterica]EBH9883246.1 hypothetical protein [Salmonella enterica subsp. enterica serovar Kisarawe]EBP4060267.1 hypothetical protein [Salmonella enterica subsp. enterica]EBV3374652.1 hypothetical protein [Salmonella enterica subsp. enterica serovar Senftenberg]EBW6019368.1 hypothetical protein [Salmonella enterica subsp. enterica serovar Infantis]ECF2431766.1 hypothetical protein [Salmonella enterica subsp. enterica serovar Beaudesert]ECG0680763.1 hypothetica
MVWWSCRYSSCPSLNKDVAVGSALPGHGLQAMPLWFSTLWLPRCDGLCRASIVAGLPWMQG